MAEPRRDTRELVPAPWSLTQREKELLDGFSGIERVPKDVQGYVRKRLGQIGRETEQMKYITARLAAEADLFRASNDLTEQRRKYEAFEGEEPTLKEANQRIRDLERKNMHAQVELQRANEAAKKERTIKERVMSEGGTRGSK